MTRRGIFGLLDRQPDRVQRGQRPHLMGLGTLLEQPPRGLVQSDHVLFENLAPQRIVSWLSELGQVVGLIEECCRGDLEPSAPHPCLDLVQRQIRNVLVDGHTDTKTNRVATTVDEPILRPGRDHHVGITARAGALVPLPLDLANEVVAREHVDEFGRFGLPCGSQRTTTARTDALILRDFVTLRDDLEFWLRCWPMASLRCAIAPTSATATPLRPTVAGLSPISIRKLGELTVQFVDDRL